jgi:hypothetical protein
MQLGQTGARKLTELAGGLDPTRAFVEVYFSLPNRISEKLAPIADSPASLG